jgi:hypothetical protein
LQKRRRHPSAKLATIPDVIEGTDAAWSKKQPIYLNWATVPERLRVVDMVAKLHFFEGAEGVVRTFLMVATAVVLSGCGSSSGVLPAGPDTYTIAKQVSTFFGGVTQAEKQALTEANDFCEQKGLKFVPSMMGPLPNGGYPSIGYSATFRCLSPTDPAVAKYQLGQAPNVVIEQRNR